MIPTSWADFDPPDYDDEPEPDEWELREQAAIEAAERELDER